MTTDQDVERRIAAWLEAGPTVPAAWAVDEAIDRADGLPQRRFITTSTRSVPMFTVSRLAAVAVVAVAIAVGAWRLLPSSVGVGSTSTSVAILPTGTFERLVLAGGGGAPLGEWTISFSDGQLWLGGPNGERIVDQIVSSTTTEFTLAPDLNPDICSFGTGAGRYAWTQAGSSLTLTSLSDGSACRATVLAGAWVAIATP